METSPEDKAPALIQAASITIIIHADLSDPTNPIWYVDANTVIEEGFENLAGHPEAFMQWLDGVKEQFASGHPSQAQAGPDTNPTKE